MSLSPYLRRYVIPGLFILWVLYVIVNYYRFHPGYLICDTVCREQYGWGLALKSMFFSASAYYFYYVLGAYGAFLLWKGRLVSITLRPIFVLVWAYVFSVVSLSILLVHTPDYITLRDGFWAQEASVLTKMGTVILVLTLLMALGLSIGSRLLRAMRMQSDVFLYSLAVGWSAMILLLFAVLALGQLKSIVVAPLLLVALAVSYVDLKKWLIWAWKTKLSFSFRAFSFESLALLIIHVVVGYSVLDAISPLPFSWDGVYRYANTVQLITAQHHFITGVFPYPFELLMSLGPLLFHSTMVGLSMTWLMGLLAGYALYSVARTLLPRNLSALVSTAFFSLPVVYFIMGRDVKVDLASLFFALTALKVLMEWREKRSRSMLLLAGVLLGMAVSIKLTTAFFAVGIIGFLMYLCWQDIRYSFKQTISTLLIFGIAAAMPLLPWIVKNIVEARPALSLQSTLQGGTSGPDLGMCMDAETTYYLPNSTEGAAVAFTGHREELGRFVGYEPMTVWRFLLKPWHATMNPTVSNGFNEIGPVFLLLLPLLVAALFTRGTNRVWIVSLSLLVGISLFLWAVFGSGVNWYALPAFSVSLVLLLLAVDALQGKKSLYAIAVGGILLSVMVTLLYRMDNQAPPQKYLFLSGTWSPEDLRNNEPPLLQSLADMINSDSPTPEHPKYVYSLRSLILYRIDDNNHRVLNDYSLDTFNCLLTVHDQDIQKTYEFLKGKGFAYIVVQPSLASIDQTPEQSLVAKKHRLDEFLTTLVEEGKLELIMSSLDHPDQFVAYKVVE